MNVLLIYDKDASVARFTNKRTEFPPIGLLSLAAALRVKEHYVSIIKIQDINHDSLLEKWQCVGLSVNASYSYEKFYAKRAFIRERADLIIVGGQHVASCPQECLMELDADYVVVGEGEVSVCELLDSIERNERPKRIPGIGGLAENEFIYVPPKRISPLWKLPHLAWDLLPGENVIFYDRIPDMSIPSFAMQTSRGCPYNCAFCGNLYHKFEYFSLEWIETAITEMEENYKIKGIVFLDENLLFNKKHAFEIFNMLVKKKLFWTCNARVDSFDDSLMRIMKEGGCVEVKYGVESGSRHLLRKMNKGITTEQIRNAFIKTKEHGIRTKAFILSGFPGENLTTIRDTIRLLDELRGYIDRVNVFDFSPVPNSLCYKKPDDYKVKLSKDMSDYRIYRNNRAWWGDDNDQAECLKAKTMLRDYVNKNYLEEK